MLNSTQAKQARGYCGLSQSVVVAETGINRSYLSKFENGHMLLPDDETTNLEKYYRGKGWQDSTADSGQPGELASGSGRPHFFDGIQVPDNFCEGTTEGILERLFENDREIISAMAEQSQTKTESTYLGLGEEKEVADVKRNTSKALAIFYLMAENYALVRQLQGRDNLIQTPHFEDRMNVLAGDELLPTIGDYVGFQIHDFDVQTAEQELEEAIAEEK